jgi:hypothetical protein
VVGFLGPVGALLGRLGKARQQQGYHYGYPLRRLADAESLQWQDLHGGRIH